MQLSHAFAIAMQLVEHLRPHCLDIVIAGSVRRQLPVVGDLELVVAPKLDAAFDLFGQAQSSVRSKDFINAVKQIGQHIEGKPDTGRMCKYMINETGLKLDLFIPMPYDFYRILAIRTGSKEYSKRIAYKWANKGWCGTNVGLRKLEDCKPVGDKYVCVKANPAMPPSWESEEEFFTWLGMPFVQSKYRIR